VRADRAHEGGKIIAADSPAGLKRHCSRRKSLNSIRSDPPFFGDHGAGKAPRFAFFEPYGLRFHAAVNRTPCGPRRGPHSNRIQYPFHSAFAGDVFIRAVESRS